MLFLCYLWFVNCFRICDFVNCAALVLVVRQIIIVLGLIIIKVCFIFSLQVATVESAGKYNVYMSI